MYHKSSRLKICVFRCEHAIFFVFYTYSTCHKFVIAIVLEPTMLLQPRALEFSFNFFGFSQISVSVIFTIRQRNEVKLLVVVVLHSLLVIAAIEGSTAFAWFLFCGEKYVNNARAFFFFGDEADASILTLRANTLQWRITSSTLLN